MKMSLLGSLLEPQAYHSATAGMATKAVANAAHRQQMARVSRILFDVTPQTHDEVIDRPRIGVFMQAPNLFQHFLARHRPILVLDQITQDVGFHQRQRKYLIANMQLEAIEMHRLVAESEDVHQLRRR